jgi:hypothetical protein
MLVQHPAPAEYTDIATMWQRGSVRCMLSGDGTTYRLTLLDGDRMLRCSLIADEELVAALARVWLRDHEHQWPRPPRFARGVKAYP